MAKCANCVNEAPYLYRVTPTFGIPYCSKHVPRFLLSELKAGNLHAPVEVVEEALVSTKSKSSKSKASEPVVEEPIVEEPVVEETSVVVEEVQAE